MDIPFNNNKKENAFSKVFSQIRDNEYFQGFSQLKYNLSKLQHSLTLLKLYGTKTKMSPKRRKIYTSTPKRFQTEPNKTKKSPIKPNKNRDFSNQIANIKELNICPINEITKTSLNTNNSKKNIFMTNINYNKKKLFNINNSLNNTNYTFSNPKKDNKNELHLNTTGFNSLSLDNKTFTKTKFISKNKNNSNNNIDKEQFPKITNNMIKNIKKENNNIKNKIYKGIEKFNIMEWYMKTRFKYAEYKYGIAEIQKYFMDIKSYGKPEEEEIEKRKTFYEHVDDIINDIHIIQNKKEMEKLNKKYGVEQDKKKIVSKKEDKERSDSEQNKNIELCKALQEIKKRRKKEKKNRRQIDDILFKCKQGVHSINILDRKLLKINDKKNMNNL